MELMELTAAQAGMVLGMSDEAIRNHITAGRLAARRHGIRGLYKIMVTDLRSFARQYNYTVDEEYLSRLAN
jgi:hypothetical protein